MENYKFIRPFREILLNDTRLFGSTLFYDETGEVVEIMGGYVRKPRP